MRPLDSLDNLTRKSGCRSKKRKVIIVSEGYVTEIGYFSALRNHVRSCNAEVLTDIVILQRYSIQSGYSDPLRIVELTDDYLRLLRTGVCSKNLFIGKVIDSLIREHPEIETEKNRAEAELKISFESGGFVIDGNMTNLDDAFVCSRRTISSVLGISDFEMVNDSIDYDETLDTICIVVDRDRDCRNKAKYERFLDSCEKRGYRPFVTNPRFELWLLFHFDIESEIDSLKDEMRYKSTIKRLLKRYGIDRKDIDCSAMIASIPRAVKASDRFCSDLELLENEIGTNLPSLMRMIFPDLNVQILLSEK